MAHCLEYALRPSKLMEGLNNGPAGMELGYPVIIPGNYGLLAPKKTPREEVETLYGALKKVVETHKDFLADRLGKLGAQTGFVGPEEYTEFLRGQYGYFGRVLKFIKK